MPQPLDLIKQKAIEAFHKIAFGLSLNARVGALEELQVLQEYLGDTTNLLIRPRKKWIERTPEQKKKHSERISEGHRRRRMYELKYEVKVQGEEPYKASLMDVAQLLGRTDDEGRWLQLIITNSGGQAHFSLKKKRVTVTRLYRYSSPLNNGRAKQINPPKDDDLYFERPIPGMTSTQQMRKTKTPTKIKKAGEPA